jgi:hypothetical protein
MELLSYSGRDLSLKLSLILTWLNIELGVALLHCDYTLTDFICKNPISK